jgi:hypothetical protein
MTKFHKRVAGLALALGFVLAAPFANAGINDLVKNGDFSLPFRGTTPSDWNATFYNSTGRFFNNPSRTYVDLANGINYMGVMDCENYCPTTQSQSISQLITGLTGGENYQLTFFAAAYAYATDKNNITTSPVAAPINVFFGGQDSGPIQLPFWDSRTTYQEGWEKVTLNFTQAANSTSALLRFVQNFTGTDPTCLPCADYLHLANVSLTDIGQGPPPPPPPGVSEPGTLGILALGLAALGLFYNRRRIGAA